MSQQIIKWCDAICYNEDEMHLGSYRTFKMIKDEAIQLSQQIQHLEHQLQQAHRHATEEVAQAHKRGWEQCKKEAFEIARTTQIGQIQTTIAAMEYKEAEDE